MACLRIVQNAIEKMDSNERTAVITWWSVDDGGIVSNIFRRTEKINGTITLISEVGALPFAWLGVDACV